MGDEQMNSPSCSESAASLASELTEQELGASMESRRAANPYFIEGPALISFSGGRTSAFMLWSIIQAHGGKLPPDVVVAFANTGKEREETLRFVHECASRWGVYVHWLEFLKRSGPWAQRYERVSFDSASRNGEPLARLIASKKTTPNALRRFCTEEAKFNTLLAFIKTELDWASWKNVIGLRHDEGGRCLKKYAQNETETNPWKHFMPLDKAKVSKADVLAFWAKQPFALGLRGYEGNCDLCFVKGRGVLKAIIRENPGAADWWIEMERIGNGSFVTEYSYTTLAREVREQPSIFDEPIDEEHDAECGTWCAPDQEAA